MTHFFRILRAFWNFLWHFFPVKLLLLHFRRSHLVLIFWLVLAALVKGWLLSSYGFHYLFVSPEYMDEVSWKAFGLLGISIGLFVMSFHISSYIFYSYRYPFLATLSRPLYRFAINNSIFPLLFISLVSVEIYSFNAHLPFALLATYLVSFWLGIALTIFVIFSYFFTTLKSLDHPTRRKVYKPLRLIIDERGEPELQAELHNGVTTYLKHFFSIRLARKADHYSNEVLRSALLQHHLNAAIFFICLIFLLIGLSLFSDISWFMLPAGATVFILFSMYMMVVGAIHARFKTWTVSGLTALLLIGNYFSGWPQFQTINYAYGMDYESANGLVPYTERHINSLRIDSVAKADKEAMLEVLGRWKLKTGSKRPPLIILNTSGGGQRSAVWTFQVLQALDSLSGGQFFKDLFLITGSSGGMIGAGYYRELAYRNLQGDSLDLHSKTYVQNIAKDLLNPVAFTLVVNDLFVRLRTFTDLNRNYPIDRGFAFERKLNENTGFVLNRRFGDYAIAEHNATIPLMILAPTVVNDGRRMLMSTQGLSFLTLGDTTVAGGVYGVSDAVEYTRLFKEQDPNNLRFVTALRMSASFPYITPLVDMPSDPPIEVIDAGVRDNDGFELSLKLLYSCKDWINKNTSGVYIIQIKGDRAEGIDIDPGDRTRLSELVRPLGGVINSFGNLQVFAKAGVKSWIPEWLDKPFEVMRFNLIEQQDHVSLSWHLTAQEKSQIEQALSLRANQRAFGKFTSKLYPATNAQ